MSNNFYGFCTPIPKIEPHQVATKMAAGETFVLQAFAHWCGHCTAASPQVQQASCGLPGVPFFKVDVDAGELGVEVESLPTVILIKAGKEVGRVEGAREAAVYVEKLGILLAGGTLPPEEDDDDEEED